MPTSFKNIKIDNSPNGAIKTGKWKNPGASLYDQILNSISCKGDIPTDPNELKDAMKKGDYKDWPDILKEVYMVAPVKDIKNSPYGRTPFSRSGCKYPHHVIKGDKMVLSVPGLRAAYICARNQGVLVNHTSENKQIVAHFNRHFRELGLKPVWHHGEFYLMEESAIKIGDNFNSIYDYIYESTGISLYDPFILNIKENAIND